MGWRHFARWRFSGRHKAFDLAFFQKCIFFLDTFTKLFSPRPFPCSVVLNVNHTASILRETLNENIPTCLRQCKAPRWKISSFPTVSGTFLWVSVSLRGPAPFERSLRFSRCTSQLSRLLSLSSHHRQGAAHAYHFCDTHVII